MITPQSTNFIVSKKDTNKTGGIFTHILLAKMENAAEFPLKQFQKINNVTTERSTDVYKVDFISNATFGDELLVNTKFSTLNTSTSIVEIIVNKKEKSGNDDIICKAIFSYKTNKTQTITA
ncbi:MAG: hypothetical protein KAG96_02750 [Ichthyobacteriaceae bacterium]|nr:hypothetical protein [Ichthyobacteriaceae bacterium]